MQQIISRFIKCDDFWYMQDSESRQIVREKFSIPMPVVRLYTYQRLEDKLKMLYPIKLLFMPDKIRPVRLITQIAGEHQYAPELKFRVNYDERELRVDSEFGAEVSAIIIEYKRTNKERRQG